MRDQRGLTLVELLVALGILSALATVMVSWVSIAARSTAAFEAQVHWELTARRVLQLVAEDITCADFEDASRAGQRRAQRIVVDRKRLTIRTRSDELGNGALRAYELVGDELRLNGAALIEGVAAFECELSEDETILTVTISSATHETVRTRRYRLP